MKLHRFLFLLLFFISSMHSFSQEKRSYKIFQFPPNMIPSIDGNKMDWSIVPDSFTVGTDQLVDDNKKFSRPDPKNLDVKVKVGWVKGLNRLYFLYEAYDNYWDFTHTGLHNDIFEIVVDADRLGGPLIDEQHPNPDKERWEAYFDFHGVHAQNYHIFTPAEGKDWALAWGSQPWIKDLPYANAAYNYNSERGVYDELESPGSFGWDGAFYTRLWVDPKEYLIGIFMSQVDSFWDERLIGKFKNLVYQSIAD